MCSCVVAVSGGQSPQQYIHKSFVKKRGFLHNEDQNSSYSMSSNPLNSPVASAPPSLGERSTSLTGSSASLPVRQHRDDAVHVLLKKHESQFKLSQGRYFKVA